MGVKRVCSQYFREQLKLHFSGLEYRGRFRHLARLLFAKDQLKVPISQAHIAYDFEVMKDYVNHRFAAIEYIDDFRNTVFDYKVIEWDFLNHQCRYAVVEFPLEVLQLIEYERMGLHQGPRVRFSDGKIFNKNVRTALIKEDKEAAALTNRIRMYHKLQNKYIEYFNNLPHNHFSKLTEYIDEALDSIEDRYENGEYIINPLAHRDQRLILQCIEEQPQPFYTYTATGNTVRLFELNRGLQGIHSYLRKILTQNCVEVDIQNAHLAIVAMLWDIPIVKEYLSTGMSIWENLIPAMGYSYPNAIIKALLKEYFYGLIYGMSQPNLRKEMKRVFGDEAYYKFINHPIIKSLLSARNKRIKEISNKTEHFTPLGIKTFPQRFRYKDGFKSNIPTILSQEASEIEMLLLEPIIDKAMGTKDFTILLYQFDGLTIKFKDAARRKSSLPKLKALVEERASSLGVITTLTY